MLKTGSVLRVIVEGNLLEITMFGLFKSDPNKKKEKQIESLYQQAVALQRNGKLREYAEVIDKIESIKKTMDDSSASSQ